MVLPEGKAEFFHDWLIYRSNAYSIGIQEEIRIARIDVPDPDYRTYGTAYKAKDGDIVIKIGI